MRKKKVVARKKPARRTVAQAAAHREQELARQASLAESARNIGEIPPCENSQRRAACERNLQKFIETYAAVDGDLWPFSEHHRRVIRRIERAIFEGGRFVEAVFRGFGKTLITELSAIWAVACGHREYLVCLAATRPLAEEILGSIKSFCESDPFAADFPEISIPVAALENITQRAHGQLYAGTPTGIVWAGDEIVFPNIPGSLAAGSKISARGYLSKIRGMNYRHFDGRKIRPDHVFIDDPQDDESAVNPARVKKSLSILRKSVLKLAGHNRRISVIIPCTVIAKDDLADQLLDHKKNPAWQGERIPLVTKWSRAHDSFWLTEYAEMRADYDPDDEDGQAKAHKRANTLYRKHRKKADRDCVVAWKHCYDHTLEISAIQHAYNALIDDGEEAFASEYQQQPLASSDEVGQLTTRDVEAKLNRRLRGEVPSECDVLTMFIDVQQTCLYYVVVAWEPGFSGWVIDYGVFPDQQKRYVLLRDVTRTLNRTYPGAGREGCWRLGLESLTKEYLAREWKRGDGATLTIDRCLIDANDGNAASTIYAFCRESIHRSVVMPSRGQGVTASSLPFRDYRRKRGDKLSDMNWRVPSPPRGQGVRVIVADTNYWKSFIRARWQMALGDKGSLSLFGDKISLHGLFIDHQVGEFSVRTEGRGRYVDEWKARPNHENHFWDCLVGCGVAASFEGVTVAGIGGRSRSPRHKNNGGGFAAMQKSARR